jgi:hypothetical protein
VPSRTYAVRRSWKKTWMAFEKQLHLTFTTT